MSFASKVDSTLQSIVSILVEKLGSQLKAIYLFGSYGTEYERKDSDLDLAILLGCALDKSKLWELKEELRQISEISVDLIDLQSTNLVFKVQVLSEGEVIWKSNDNFVSHWEVDQMSMRANLEFERKEILADIQERGSIYG